MMSKNSNNRSRGTEGVPCLKRTLIGKQNKIHVVIRRRNISSPGPPGQIERSIDDPKLISPLVHLWQDWQHTRRSIFDRKGIVVNQPEQPDQELSRPTRSRTPSRSKSPASFRNTKNSTRKKSNSPRERSNSSRERSNSPRTRNNSPNEKGKERSPQRRKHLDQRKSSERFRRSRSLDIKKNVENFRERRSGSRERITGSARKKEKDSEHTCFRKKSISPLRPGEYIPFHPDLKKRYRAREERKDNIRYSRHSRSLSRDRYKASTSTRRSVSPHYNKSSYRQLSRSRSPRKHSHSPSRKQWKSRSPETYSEDKRVQGAKRNSRSPYARSPVKYSGRSSRSPSNRHDEHRQRSVSQSRRSRSPHSTITSFSPSRSRNRRPRSRSPNERGKRYRDSRRDYRRSRSRSPNWRTRSRSPKEQYKGYHPAFGYFEGLPGPDPFWYPGHMQTSYSAGLPPRFYPPAYYPRSVPPGPIILPPRYPMMFPPARPRIIYNNRKMKPITQSNESESLSREPPVRVSETSVISTITESGNDSITKGDVEKEETKD